MGGSPDDQADLSAVLKHKEATLNNPICSRLQVFGALAVCTRGRPCEVQNASLELQTR